MRSIPARVVACLSVAVAVLAFALSASSTSAATIPLVVGQQAFTTGQTNVRATADGTLVGTQPRYAIGTVVAGPVTVSGNSTIWYKVTFNTGPSGWVGADMLIDGVPLPKSVNVGTGTLDTMALDENGNIELVFTTGTDPNDRYNHTYSFSESTNQGLSFSTPAVLPLKTATFTPLLYPPQIAIERNGALDIVYTCPPSQCNFGVGNPSVVIIRSIDHGSTWSAPIQISIPPHPADSGADEPVIAACGAGVTIAWTDDGVGTNRGPDLNADLYIVNVVNGVPGAPINITDDTAQVGSPQLLVNPQGTVYVSWTSTPVNATNSSVLFTSLPNCAAVAQ
jgi:hypothetical protein